MPHSLAGAAFAFAIAAIATAATIRVCRKYNWLCHPRKDRWSPRSVARYGGLAIVLPFAAVALLSHPGSSLRNTVLLTLAMSAIGLWDDVVGLSPRIKLLGQMVVATLAVWSGVCYPFGDTFYLRGAFTIFWLVGVTNAFNLLDNMDGLAAGVGVIVAVSQSLLAFHGAADALSLGMIMAAALAAFLMFNFYPAKIFMGDAGSLGVGFFLASLMVVGTDHLSTTISIIAVPSLVLFIPLFDMALVSITRRLAGRAISTGAKDHSSHRLVLLGMTDRQSVLTLYGISILSGAAAYLCKTLLNGIGIGVLALFLLVATLLWLYLAQLKLPEDWVSRTNIFTWVLPQVLNSLAARAGAVFFDICLILLSQYLAFVIRFDGVPKVYLTTFFCSCALAVAVKIPLLAIFSVYTRNWALTARQDVYSIVKVAIVSMLLSVTIVVFVASLKDYSRMVFILDCILTILLLSGVRASARVFDDAIASAKAPTCLVVGEESFQFYVRYFEWQKLRRGVMALVQQDPRTTSSHGVPVFTADKARRAFQKHGIEDVYVLPDCPLQLEREITRLCREHNATLHRIRFSIDTTHVALSGMPSTAQRAS